MAFKTIKKFVDEALVELTGRTNNKIIQPVTGSVVRSIFEAIATIHFFIQTMIKKVYDALYISRAVGVFLDGLAKNFLTERKRATYATGIVRIERVDDTTEQYLNAGTIFATDEPPNGNRKYYILQEQIRFPIGVLEMEGTVQAQNIGTIGNTDANTIINVINDNIAIQSVTNELEISNGVDDETDKELRDRLFLKVLSLLGGNERTIRSAALTIEGVIYAFVIDDVSRSGITHLFINNQEGNLDSSIIDEVREVIEEYRPVGVIVNIARTPVRHVSLYCKLKLQSTFIDPSFANDIKITIKDFVNSLQPSEGLRKSDLIGFIEQIEGVDYVINEPSNGGLQLKINDQFEDIINLDSIEMIRTSTDFITIDIEE